MYNDSLTDFAFKISSMPKNSPICVRVSIISCAISGVMPGKVINSPASAVLMFIGWPGQTGTDNSAGSFDAGFEFGFSFFVFDETELSLETFGCEERLSETILEIETGWYSYSSFSTKAEMAMAAKERIKIGRKNFLST